MSKKRLDDATLEAIAEVICGSGQGAGGGPAYDSPGPFRSKSEIHSFFSRAGIEPTGQSSTRKWFVLESLLDLNRDPTGNLLSASLERVLLRLGSPKVYRGDAETTQKVIDYLSKILQIEGVEIILDGGEPTLREKSPGIPSSQANKTQIISPPNLEKLASYLDLARILNLRWEEAQKCVLAGAFLSAVIMMGSILEGVLLHRVESDLKTTCMVRQR